MRGEPFIAAVARVADLPWPVREPPGDLTPAVVSRGDIAPELRGRVPIARIAVIAFAVSAAAFALSGWHGPGGHHVAIPLAPVIVVLLLFRALARGA